MHTLAKYEGMEKTIHGDNLIIFSIPSDLSDKLSKYQDKDISLDIELAYDKRSLNANKYLWKVIVPPIAKALHLDDWEAYIYLIHKHGIHEDVSCIYESVPIISRQYRYAEVYRDGYYYKEPQPNDIVTLRVWMGSSHYDRAEMARFIDLCQQEMRDIGLGDVLFTDEEVERLLEKWKPQEF